MNNDPIVQLLIVFLTTPQTDFYLPKLLQKSSNPTLEPYQSSSLNLGTASLIGTDTSIALSDLMIKGISNIQIEKHNGKPRIDVQGSKVTFYAQRPNTESPTPGLPVNMIIDANFSLTPAGQSALPQGKIHIEIVQAEITGIFNVSSENGNADQAVTTFTSLTINAATNASNIIITITLDSFFKDMINQVFASDNVLAKLLAAINSKINTPDALAAVSQAGTQAARAALKNSPVGS